MMQRVGVSQAILSQFVEHAQVGTLAWYKPTVDNEGEAAALAYEFARNQAQESMLVILLDKDNKPLSVLRHSLGGMSSTSFAGNIMAGVAAGTPGCRSVYMVHNHPSGTTKFSAADMTAAVTLSRLMEGVGVKFNGSIVVTDAEVDPSMSGRGEGAYGPRYIFHPGGKDVVSFLNDENLETASKPITLAADTPGGEYKPGMATKGASNGIALTERVFQIRGKALAPKISNGTEAVLNIVPLLGGKPGIAFMDKGNRIMAVLPLTLQEMANLVTTRNKRGTMGIKQANDQRFPRTTSETIDVGSTAQDNNPLARILTVMDRSNTEQIIISIGDAAIDSEEVANATDNVKFAAEKYKITVLDVINNKRNINANEMKPSTLGGVNQTPKLPTGERLGFNEGDEEYDPSPIENEEAQAAQDYPEIMANRKATQRADGGEDGGAGIEGIVRNGLQEGETVGETNPEDPNAGAEFARQEREAGARVNSPQDSGLEAAKPAEPIIKKTRKPRAKPAAPNPSVFPTKLDSTLPFGRLTGEQMAQFGLSDAMLDQFVEHSTIGHVMSGVEFVKSADDAAHVVAGMRKRAQEQIILLITDKNGRPIQIAGHQIGSPTATGFNPGILVGTAASTPGAAKVWFIHNHPSGKSSLSPADISSGGNVERLLKAANLDYMGTMAVAGTRYAQMTPGGRIESNMAIKAAPRKFKVPVTERIFSFRVSHDKVSHGDPSIAMTEAERIFGKDQPGLILLDNSNRMVATIPLAADVLQAMKAKIPGTDQTGFNRFVSGIDRSNPVNLMIYTASLDQDVARKVIENMSGVAQATKINVLDAFGAGGVSRQSYIRPYGSDFNEANTNYNAGENPAETAAEGGVENAQENAAEAPQTLRDVVDQAAKKKNELEVGEGEPDADSMAEALKAEPIPSAADMAKLTGRLVPNHDDGLLASQGFITKRASQDMAKIMERINKRFPDGYPVNGWKEDGTYVREKKKIANLRLRYTSDNDPIGNYEAQDYVLIDAVFEDGTTRQVASLDLMRGYASTPEFPTLVTKVGMSDVNGDLQKLGLGSILYVEGGERLRRMGQRYLTGSVINPAAVATRVKAFPAGSTELLAVPGSVNMSQKQMAQEALLIIKSGQAAYTQTTLDPNVALEPGAEANQGDQLTEPGAGYDDGENMRIPGGARDKFLDDKAQLEKAFKDYGYMTLGHGIDTHGDPRDKTGAWKKNVRLFIIDEEGMVKVSDTLDKEEKRYIQRMQKEWVGMAVTLKDMLKVNPSTGILIHRQLFAGMRPETVQGRVEVRDGVAYVSVIKNNHQVENTPQARRDRLDHIRGSVRDALFMDGINEVRVIDMSMPADADPTREADSAREPGIPYDDGENTRIPGSDRDERLKKIEKQVRSLERLGYMHIGHGYGADPANPGAWKKKTKLWTLSKDNRIVFSKTVDKLEKVYIDKLKLELQKAELGLKSGDDRAYYEYRVKWLKSKIDKLEGESKSSSSPITHMRETSGFSATEHAGGNPQGRVEVTDEGVFVSIANFRGRLESVADERMLIQEVRDAVAKDLGVPPGKVHVADMDGGTNVTDTMQTPEDGSAREPGAEYGKPQKLSVERAFPDGERVDKVPFSNQAKALIPKGYKVEIENKSGVNPTFSLTDKDGNYLLSVNLSFRMKETKGGLELVQSPARKKAGFPDKGASVFVEAFIPRDQTLGSKHDEAMVGLFHEILERSRQIGATRVYFDTLDHGRLTLGSQDGTNGETAMVDGNPFSAIQVAMGKTGPEDWRHFDENWSEAVFALDPNKAYEPGMPYDDGENQAIPGGGRQAWLKQQAELRAKNELPGAKRIQWWTDVGHKVGKKNREKTWLWAYDKQGKLQVINAQELKDKLEADLDSHAGQPTHLDWEEMYVPGLLAGAAHGRIDATGDIIRVSLAGRISDPTFREQVKQELAAYIGADVDKVKGYDFTGDGMPEVFDPAAGYNNSDPALTPDRNVANHSDKDLANRGFITREATKMDLPGAKLEIYPMKVKSRFPGDSTTDEIYKGHIIYKGKKIAVFDFSMAEGSDVMELEWIKVNPTYRGLGLSKVIIAEIVERAKRSGFEEAYATVVDPENRPTKAFESVLGAENVDWEYGQPEETHGRDPFRQRDPDTGEWIVEPKDVSVKIPNQYTESERKLLADIKNGINERKNLARWKKIQEKNSTLLNQVESNQSDEVDQLVRDLEGMDVDEAEIYFKNNPDKALLVLQNKLPPHLEKIVNALRQIGYNETIAYLNAHPIGRMLVATGRIVVVKSRIEVPGLSALEAEAAGFNAIVLGKNREATYFVGGEISKAEIDALIKHEVGVHMGIGKDTDLVNDLYAELQNLIQNGALDDVDRAIAGDAVATAIDVVINGIQPDENNPTLVEDILRSINSGNLSTKERYTDERITRILREEGMTGSDIDVVLRMFHEETLGYLMNVMARREAGMDGAKPAKDGLFALIVRWIKQSLIRMAYARSQGGDRPLAGKVMRGFKYASMMASDLKMESLAKLLEIRPADIRAIAQGYAETYANGKEVKVAQARDDSNEIAAQMEAMSAQESRPNAGNIALFNRTRNEPKRNRGGKEERTISFKPGGATAADIQAEVNRQNAKNQAKGSTEVITPADYAGFDKPQAGDIEPAVAGAMVGPLGSSQLQPGERDAFAPVEGVSLPNVSIDVPLVDKATRKTNVETIKDARIILREGIHAPKRVDDKGGIYEGGNGHGLVHILAKHRQELRNTGLFNGMDDMQMVQAAINMVLSSGDKEIKAKLSGTKGKGDIETEMILIQDKNTGLILALRVHNNDASYPGYDPTYTNKHFLSVSSVYPADPSRPPFSQLKSDEATMPSGGAPLTINAAQPAAQAAQSNVAEEAGNQPSVAEETGEQLQAKENDQIKTILAHQGNGPAGPALLASIPPTPPPPAPTTPTTPAPAPLNPPANNDDMARRIGDVLRGRYFDGISTKAHQNAKRTGSAAVRAIADIIHTRPGTENPSSDRDLPKAIMTARAKYQNRFNDIMRPLRDQLAGMKSDQREQFYRDLVDQITGRTNIQPGIAGHAATQLIALLKELHDYRTAAGEDLGQVQQYFPAVYNSALITANRTAFIADATRAYEIELSQDPNLTPQEIQAKAAAAAVALYRTHTRGMGDAEWASIFNTGKSSPTENSSKERVFGRQAQGIMAKWQTPDPFYVISRYIASAVKRAELVRRFGPEGKNWEAMSNAMEADGVPIETINEMAQLVQLAAGLGTTPLDNSERMFMDTVNLYTAAAAMGKSAMNNLYEPAAMGVRASTPGNPFRTVNAYAETWARFIRNLIQMLPVLGDHVGPTFWQEYGEHIGSIHNSLDDAWMSMHAMEHGMEEANPKMRWLTNRVYQANLMESTENAKLQASHALGHAYILDHASMLDGSHWIARLLKFDTRSTAEEALLELGIPKSKQDAFAAWCAMVKQTKDRAARMAMLTDGSEMARLYEEAQIRFSHQSAVRANRAHKPVFQDAVLGRLALQLMSFSYSYYSEVTDRMYRMASRAITTRDMPAIQRINMMLPLMLSPLTVVAMAALFETKDLLFPTESSEKRKKDHWIYKLFNATSFAGAFGPKVEMATKYIARDQPPGGIAGQTIVAGARVGKKAIELMMDDTKSQAQKEAELKAAAGRAAVNPIKGTGVILGSLIHPVAGAAAVAMTNDTGWSNALQEKPATPKKGSIPPSRELPGNKR